MKKWTKQEIDLLYTHYANSTADELHLLFPDRQMSQIITKANELRLCKREFWSEEEDRLLIDKYECTHIDDLLPLFPNRNRNSIIKHAIKLHLHSLDDPIWTEEQIQYFVDNWTLLSDQLIGEHIGKTRVSVKRMRNLLGYHRQNKDQPSYETLAKYIRGNIYDWKLASMINCNYQCVLTGSKNFEIHHLYPVNKILNDVYIKNDIQPKPFDNYSSDELSIILKLFIEEQQKHPLGECVRKDIHVLFHSQYGQYNTTPEQWYKFKKDYNDGLYQ